MDEVPEKKKSKMVVVSDSVESSPPVLDQNLEQKTEANNPAPEEKNLVKSPSAQLADSTQPSLPQDEERPRRPSLLKVSTPKEDGMPKSSSLVFTDSSASLPSDERPKKKKKPKRSASGSDQLPRSSSLILTDSSGSIVDEGRPRKKKKSKRSRSKEAKLARSSSTLISDSSESLMDDGRPRKKKKKKAKRSKSKEGKLSQSSSTQLTGSSASIESTGRRKKRKKPKKSKSKELSLSRSSSTQFTQTPPPPTPPKSCPGCKLDDLQDIKSFIQKDLPKYEGITFKKGRGLGPELVIFDNNNKERERIPLQHKTRKQCNALLVEKGFKLKGDSMHSLLSEGRADSSTGSTMSLLS